jgi:hypothetical protein
MEMQRSSSPQTNKHLKEERPIHVLYSEKIKEEEDILYSLFGLGKRKRKRIVVEKKTKLSKKRRIISFLILLFR